MAKVLICHSDAGNGPLSASTALAEGIRVVSDARAEVSIIDVLQETNKFGFLTVRLYNFLLSKSLAWNSVGLQMFYHSSLVKSGALLAETVGLMKKLLEKERADAVVFTNPWIIGYVLRAVRQMGGRKPRLVSLVIDIGGELPPGWYDPDIDIFVVASQESRQELISFGADPSRVRVLGMPVGLRFLGAARKGDEPVRTCADCGATVRILVMGGKFGTRNTYPIIRGLSRLSEPFHLTVLCGSNRTLKEKIDDLATNTQRGSSSAEPTKHIVVKGFVPDVYPYMREASLLVTKPGALTVSEAITFGLPLVLDVYPRVMGQEIGNVRYVTSRGLGLIAEKPERVPKLVSEFIRNGSFRNRLLNNCRNTGRLGNTFQIAREILGSIQV